MSDFLAMDGYAVWVWSAWGVSALTLTGLFVWTLIERKTAEARLVQLEEDAS